jgi:hypothetical protein
MEIRYRKDWGTDLLVDDKTGGKNAKHGHQGRRPSSTESAPYQARAEVDAKWNDQHDQN